MSAVMSSLPWSAANERPVQFDGRNVRIVEIDGEVWFVATDIARELGYDHTPHLIRLLDDDEKGVHTMDTLGGIQVATIISEPGLYRAIVQRRANKKHDDALLSRIERFPDELRLRDIVKCPQAQANDVSGQVEFCGQVVSVPDVLIQRLVERERAGEFNATFRRGRRTFAKLPEWVVDGGIVRIKDGSFAGFVGAIEHIEDEKGKLTVAVEMFGRATRVELAIDNVCAL